MSCVWRRQSITRREVSNCKHVQIFRLLKISFVDQTVLVPSAGVACNVSLLRSHIGAKLPRWTSRYASQRRLYVGESRNERARRCEASRNHPEQLPVRVEVIFTHATGISIAGWVVQSNGFKVIALTTDLVVLGYRERDGKDGKTTIGHHMLKDL